jgi:N4-gp56 family major capsid protein
MATTTSSSTGQSDARYTELIEKGLLEVGENEYVFRAATEEGKLKGVSGHSNQLKINRQRRIAIPSAAATEGTAPTPTTLEVDQATGTASQYVMSVQFTDVAEIYAFYDLLNDAIFAVKDCMRRLDEKICSDAFVAASNVLYPDGITARSSLVATSYLNTAVISKAVGALRRGSNVFGPAMPFEGGLFKGLMHVQVEQDMVNNDPQFRSVYERAQRTDLFAKGVIADYAGVRWHRYTWGPEYVLGTDDATSLTETSSTGGPTHTNSLQYCVVRKDILRMFSESITATITQTDGTNDYELELVMPATAGYLYDVYVSASDSATPVLKLHANGINLAPSAAFATGAAFGTGATAPVAPATGVNVRSTWILGKKAVKSSDLRSLETFITPKTSTHEDPAQQKRTVAAKFFNGAFIQQNEWMRKIDSATAFA